MSGQATEITGALWHPFADMHAVQETGEFLVDRADGVWLYDADGRRYLDGSAGLWYCNVGHGRAEIADAAARQLQRLAGYQIFDSFANRPARELAQRISELVPMSGACAAFFTSGGSDSIDTAAKIARRYWAVKGEPDRRVIIAREGAYHGVNAYGTSLAGLEANAAGWGPLVPDVVHVPRDDVAAIEHAVVTHPGQVAAFIGEPVQAAAGVYPPAADYWPAVRDLCREHDVLLIADEVVTGFGRLGRWFASERYEIEPDMIVGAKGLSSGYLPIGVVVAGERVRDVLWSPGAGAFRHGYTYSGHPAACAVALANLDIIEREHLVERVARLEPVLDAAVGTLASHPLVREVRTAGLLAGVELAPSPQSTRAQVVQRVVAGARERGVIVRNLVGQTLQISPPFVIDEAQLRLIATTLEAALDDVLNDDAATDSATAARRIE